jgi:hypothetical protein
MKLAFCFLIYDKINHEDLWNIFFSNVDTSKYSIYIHYKRNAPLQYFEAYKLPNCIETKHGDISLVYAQNILLSEGLKDSENRHFIFVSGSCIPFKSFNYIYNNLDTAYSYFNVTPKFECFPRCYGVLTHVKHINKSHQWCILNKKHAQLMIDKNEYLKWFEDVFAADEHCYITNIYANALENEIITTPNLSTNATTFTNWGGMDYKYVTNGVIKNYLEIHMDELKYILESKSMFGRKFDEKCSSTLNNDVYVNYIRSS